MCTPALLNKRKTELSMGIVLHDFLLFTLRKFVRETLFWFGILCVYSNVMWIRTLFVSIYYLHILNNKKRILWIYAPNQSCRDWRRRLGIEYHGRRRPWRNCARIIFSGTFSNSYPDRRWLSSASCPSQPVLASIFISSNGYQSINWILAWDSNRFLIPLIGRWWEKRAGMGSASYVCWKWAPTPTCGALSNWVLGAGSWRWRRGPFPANARRTPTCPTRWRPGRSWCRRECRSSRSRPIWIEKSFNHEIIWQFNTIKFIII